MKSEGRGQISDLRHEHDVDQEVEHIFERHQPEGNLAPTPWNAFGTERPDEVQDWQRAPFRSTATAGQNRGCANHLVRLAQTVSPGSCVKARNKCKGQKQDRKDNVAGAAISPEQFLQRLDMRHVRIPPKTAGTRGCRPAMCRTYCSSSSEILPRTAASASICCSDCTGSCQ